MKIETKLGIAIATVATIAAAFVAQAQADDNLAASPRLRQQLNDRAPATVAAVPAPAHHAAAAGRTMVSTQGQATMNKPADCCATGAGMCCGMSTCTQTAADGITASPRLRQQLNERSAREFQVAPIK